MTSSTLLWFSLLFVAFLAAWWAHLAFWSRRLSVPLAYALEEEVVLKDGTRIALRRLHGEGSASVHPPVLLVHGIAVNHRNNDLVPQRSFARFLAERGRDVWLVTMRSGQTRLSPVRPRDAFKAMRDHDLPGAVDEVLRRTRSDQLDLCCYSMGGMVVYAALGRTLDPAKVRRVIVFASPGFVRPLGLLTLARFIPPWLTPPVPMRIFMRTLAFAHGVLPGKTLEFFYNPRNVPPEFARSSMMNLFEDIPGPLGADMVRWAADRGRIVIDGEPLLEGLRGVQIPVCFFAGTRDYLAPAKFVRAAHDAWGADVDGVEKVFVLRGRELGAREDYGHGDFAFGTHAQEEVWLPALAFLEGRPVEAGGSADRAGVHADEADAVRDLGALEAARVIEHA